MKSCVFENKNNIDVKKKKKHWSYIENAVPGSKELLEEICLTLTLMYSSVSIFQNKKRKKGVSIYKYHIISKTNNEKLCTIYINSTKDYKIRIFTNKKIFHEALILKFTNLNDLRENLIDWISYSFFE